MKLISTLIKPTILVGVSTLIIGCAVTSTTHDEATCEGHANYQVTFTSTWSPETHPGQVPDKPHFSHTFGVTHNSDLTIWAPGMVVKQGVKDIAEKGSGYALIKETLWDIRVDRALDIFDGNEIKHSPGTSSAEFQVNAEFPLITLVNMLAPSPDWISGVSALNLCENGQWIENKTLKAEVYDAGTDDGQRFASENQARSPHEPVSLLTEAGRSEHNAFAPVGRFAFTKIDQITQTDGSGYVKKIKDHFAELNERRR